MNYFVRQIKIFTIPLIGLIFLSKVLHSQNINIDENKDLFLAVMNSNNNFKPVFSKKLNNCFRIGIIEAGFNFDDIIYRLNSIGFENTTLLPDTSGLSDFIEFDLIYLPSCWAQFYGSLTVIESKSIDYISYVENGGNLFVEQPNPYGQPGDSICPSILPYPITFYNSYDPDDFPPIAVDTTHYITFGIDNEELPFPADRMKSLDENYHILVCGATTLDPSLVITDYENGKILVCTANSSAQAITQMSDDIYKRMINWLVNPPTIAAPIITCDSYTWIDGNTYTESNNTATHALTNTEGCDSIVQLNLTITKLDTSYSASVIVCDSYIWIDGNTYTDSNKTATYTLTSSEGCDSTVQLNLTIIEIDTSVTINNHTLISNMVDADYQWLDCEDNFELISGAVSQSFTPTKNGTYAVRITQNQCIDTSFSFVVTPNETIQSVKVYPNPTTGTVIIDLNKLIRPSVRVFDSLGALIFEKNEINEWLFQFQLNGSAGLYFVEVIYGEERKIFLINKV
jgi:hypothetical protein